MVVDGLISREAAGAGGRLPEAKMSGVRWRCVDLCGEAGRRFGVGVAKQTLVEWLRTWRSTWHQPRPYDPKRAAAAQEGFK